MGQLDGIPPVPPALPVESVPAPPAPVEQRPATPTTPPAGDGVRLRVPGSQAAAPEPLGELRFGDDNYNTVHERGVRSWASVDGTTIHQGSEAVQDTRFFSAAQLRSPATREAFLRRCTQIDGNDATVSDRQACGLDSLITGMLIGDPSSVQAVARGLNSANGRALFPTLDRRPSVQAAIDHLAVGRFSSHDVRELLRALYESVASGSGGTSATDLIGVVGRFRDLGVRMPPMEIQGYGPPGSVANGAMAVAEPRAAVSAEHGHWIVVAQTPDHRHSLAVDGGPQDSDAHAFVADGSRAYAHMLGPGGTSPPHWRLQQRVVIADGGDTVTVHAHMASGRDGVHSTTSTTATPYGSQTFRRTSDSASHTQRYVPDAPTRSGEAAAHPDWRLFLPPRTPVTWPGAVVQSGH